jgi:hypothetical protein
MITKDNLKSLLLSLNFEKSGHQYSKKFTDSEAFLKVDFDKSQLIYPEDHGLKIHERQTCNFSSNENFVVFECVHRLLELVQYLRSNSARKARLTNCKLVLSKRSVFFQSRRHFSRQANDRSTTRRWGITAKA